MNRTNLFTLAACVLAAAQSAADDTLDVNDVAFLWPMPQAGAAADEWINLEDVISQPTFQRVLTAAGKVRVGVNQRQIRMAPGFDDRSNWKVAGIRVDPVSVSPLTPGEKVPQIRLVAQPVTGGEVHDAAMHVVFSFAKDGKADREKVRALADDLAAIKQALGTKNIGTSGPLGVHPGFAQQDSGLPNALREFLKKHAAETHLEGIAFMGIDSPEPWIFFVMVNHPVNGLTALPGQMLSFRDAQAVTPQPAGNTNWKGKSLSTAPLLEFADLDSPAFPGDPESPRMRDVPDVIANPEFVHLANTKDCISCHTESMIRHNANLGPSRFRFRLPRGISGVNPGVLPRDPWNVRNFGWFEADGPTVTMRVANESAESAAGFNTVLAARPSVSNGLNLIMTIPKTKRAELEQRIKALAEGDTIRGAMRRLGTVHFARFVFIDDEHVAMITSFDGDFETYIDAFANEIGPVFDELFTFVKDAPPSPVKEHPAELLKFVTDHNRPNASFFSAYPDLTAAEIQIMKRRSRPNGN